MGKSFYDAGIVSEVLIYAHPDGRETRREWYPESTSMVHGRDFATRCRTDVAHFLSKIDVCLFFETPFDWNVLPLCKKHGVKTVLVPMYEWSLLNPPYSFDKVICPSLLDQQYFPGAPFLPIPVEPKFWKPRTKALRFLHNGGGIGSREHKGTRQLIESIPYVQPPISLTIRAQNGAALERILAANPAARSDRRVTWEFGERLYETLWDDHDVLIAPEKFTPIAQKAPTKMPATPPTPVPVQVAILSHLFHFLSVSRSSYCLPSISTVVRSFAIARISFCPLSSTHFSACCASLPSFWRPASSLTLAAKSPPCEGAASV